MVGTLKAGCLIGTSSFTVNFLWATIFYCIGNWHLVHFGSLFHTCNSIYTFILQKLSDQMVFSIVPSCKPTLRILQITEVSARDTGGIPVARVVTFWVPQSCIGLPPVFSVSHGP
ncbi:hypothetical protein F5Y17DRAFT_416806 [Xylariaceae sp. FL0594]|nr:hypothetical protein F5Y17DRAFT_416806 [Xylariaceae sp. FL0594]